MRCSHRVIAIAVILMVTWVSVVHVLHSDRRAAQRVAAPHWAQPVATASLNSSLDTKGFATLQPSPPPRQQGNRTYDDITRHEIDASKYTYARDADLDEQKHLPPRFCDDATIPFVGADDERCTRFLTALLNALTTAAEGANESVMITYPNDGDRVCALIDVQPMEQHFEQRTVKFKMIATYTLCGKKGRRTVAAVIKVPQMLFQVEPFSEVAAFAVDRALKINRIPPTALVDLPVSWFERVVSGRRKHEINMVPEFLRASGVASYDEWIRHDFVNFVRSAKRGRSPDSGGKHASNDYMKDSENVYASVQLFMREVQPLLSSVLKVPYSKQSPGWHRWFNPDNHVYDGHLQGALLALSELAVFDFLTMNNDRSPNKNNFVAGGCAKCRPIADRRPSGSVPTFVHLDQGMAFYGPSHLIHNPLGKPPPKVTFCIFYRPLVEELRRVHAADDWAGRVLARLPSPVLNIIGEDKLVGGVKKQMGKVLGRVDTCLTQYPENVVLRP